MDTLALHREIAHASAVYYGVRGVRRQDIEREILAALAESPYDPATHHRSGEREHLRSVAAEYVRRKKAARRMERTAAVRDEVARDLGRQFSRIPGMTFEDARQEAQLAMLGAGPHVTVRGGGSERRHLRSVARTRLRNLARAARCRPLVRIDGRPGEALADPSPGPAAAAEATDLSASLLAGLSPQQRAVIVATYRDGLCDAEVAERLGTNVASVQDARCKALARLKRTCATPPKCGGWGSAASAGRLGRSMPANGKGLAPA